MRIDPKTREMRRTHLFFSMGLAVTLAFALFRCEQAHRQELRLRMWDVGQGDAIWIQFPDKTTWLVDTGGKQGQSSAAARVLLPELASESHFSVDKIILSHTDEDHAFGTLDLLLQSEVKEIVLNATFRKPAFSSPLLQRIRQLAEAKQVAIRWVEEKESFSLGHAKAEWWPVSIGSEKNNQVLALFLEHQGCRFVFLGDAEEEAEQEILNEWSSQRQPPIHVLKVAHHGSKTSTHVELLDRMQPQLALISAGVKNRYGHPHSIVVNRLHNRAIQVMRTDRHGYIELRTTPAGTLHCFSHSGFCGEFSCGYQDVLNQERENFSLSD